MADALLSILEQWGIWGILLSLLIEGSAFPFIGTFFIVTVGFVMDLSWFELAWISILGSFLYAAGSYIPYYLGYKLGSSVVNRLSEKRRESLEKATAAFRKYGIWSVAISSPLHLGNVVPFVAGMSRMNLLHYTLLTMLGIAPSTFVLLSIGQYYTGDVETVVEIINEYQVYVLIGFILVTAVYAGWKLYQRNKHKNRSQTKKNNIEA